MINSVFDTKTSKKMDKIAIKQAKLDAQKNELVKEAMKNTDAETIEKVMQVIKEFGHPNEKKEITEIEKKYSSGEDLGFNDILNLENLYKSNYMKFKGKEK